MGTFFVQIVLESAKIMLMLLKGERDLFLEFCPKSVSVRINFANDFACYVKSEIELLP